MVVATGIANIWARDPFTMTAAQLTLAEAYPDRFLLGLGVSHARLVEGLRGHQYERPSTAMRRYLDAMDKAAEAYRAVKPGGEAGQGAGRAWPLARRRGCRWRSSRHKAPVQQTSACGSGTHLRILPGQPINGS
jgi:alkanesulfonate monooxygenase SsuD/methylene tetrahydromethanopterin reductase-like flavin-dependent oxidoreductase (luciferase family)